MDASEGAAAAVVVVGAVVRVNDVVADTVVMVVV